MKNHSGQFETCRRCLGYIRLGEQLGDISGYATTTRKLHKVAIDRRDRDQAFRDAGLTKVRGSLGGVYWE